MTRAGLTERILDIKREMGWTWRHICDEIGGMSDTMIVGALLGQMKLVMPNSYNIYLHDTPARGLFTLGERAFSHGCIRVGDALGFAETLLDGARSRADIDRLVHSADGLGVRSSVVSLPQALPVYVTYFTADARADGSIAFHKDIYGRDAGIVSVDGARPEQLALQ